MELRQIAKIPCIGSSCPTIYETDRDTVVVQGYVVTDATGVDVPTGETLVEIPKDLIKQLIG